MLNGEIFQKHPKNFLISRQVLKIGLSPTVSQHIHGVGGIINIRKEFQWTLLIFYCLAFGKRTKKIRSSTGKSAKAGNNRKKQLRASAKGHIYKKNEEKGETYQSGAY